MQFFQVYLIKEFDFNQKQIGMLFGYIGLWIAFTQGVVNRVVSVRYMPAKVLRISLLWMGVALLAILLPREWKWLLVVHPFVALAQGVTGPNITSIISIPVSGARAEYVGSGVPSSGYVGTYGYLYNWYAVADSRKLCPTGWHVPSKDEWDILISYLGTNAGGKMQLISTLWSSQSSGANNSSGFTAIPGGQGGGPISNFISSASYFWSSSQRPTGGVGAPSASNIRLENSLNLFNEYIDQFRGLSVRCLKD
jgi:uncharacterized protein (TIGR02145 family)